MTPSLQLLLEDFLGLMREEGELDVYLPLLLSAMGHEIVYRAQKGTRQYGVDISSVGKDLDGRKKLFLWLVKRGDLGRADWDVGEQSIRQSINDVGDTYIRSHVAPQHAQLPKKLAILTNGDFNAALNLTIASFLPTWSANNGVETQTVNGSTLAAWTEQYLLDEHVLPPANRALLRRMLANVGTPELSISVGRELVTNMVREAAEPARTKAATKKRRLTAIRGLRTALSVLYAWAQREENLLAPYRIAEFAVLCVWANLHQELRDGDGSLTVEYGALLFQMSAIASTYHDKLHPYYATQDAFAHALPDSLLVNDAVFQELGRLGVQGGLMAFFSTESENQDLDDLAGLYANRILMLLETHACTQLPAYDRHSGDIHSALILLLMCGHRDRAKGWLDRLVRRVAFVANKEKYWPHSAPFEEALLVRHGYQEMSEQFSQTSTLVPILLLWTAALGMRDAYIFLRNEVIPAIEKTTLNFWSSDIGFDHLVADPGALFRHGVGEAVMFIPEGPNDFLTKMAAPLDGVESIENAVWYGLRSPYIPLLAALHWRVQLPRELLVKQAVALSEHGAKQQDSTPVPAEPAQQPAA
jgi:hypothetical protein